MSTTGDGVTTYSCRPDRYAKITDEGVFPHAGDPRALVGYQP